MGCPWPIVSIRSFSACDEKAPANALASQRQPRFWGSSQQGSYHWGTRWFLRASPMPTQVLSVRMSTSARGERRPGSAITPCRQQQIVSWRHPTCLVQNLPLCAPHPIGRKESVLYAKSVACVDTRSSTAGGCVALVEPSFGRTAAGNSRFLDARLLRPHGLLLAIEEMAGGMGAGSGRHHTYSFVGFGQCLVCGGVGPARQRDRSSSPS